MNSNGKFDKDKVPIEEAIDRAGFGLYSYLLTSLAGAAIICYACVAYGSTILVPASACELETTPAQQGLLAAVPVIGSIVGSVVWGYLADTKGRRKMLLAALLSGAVVNSIGSISVNWIMLMTTQVIASMLTSGLFSMSMSILSESVPMAKRNVVVLLVTSIFLLSQGVMAVLAIPIIPLSYSIHIPALGIYWNSWRTLVLVYSLPSVITAICVYFMKESPKFMFSQGKDQEALEILRTIHRVNHLRSKEEYLVNSILKEEVKTQEQGGPVKQNLIVQLFRMPLLKYTLIMTTLFLLQRTGTFMVWLPTVANQFMRIVESGEGFDMTFCQILRTGIETPVEPDAVPCALNVNALLIVLAVGAIQSVFNLLLSMIVNQAGRRNIVIVMAVVCGAAGIVVNLIPNAIGSAAMFVLMLQGIVIMGMYTAITVAIFPTHLRALAIAIPTMGGRVGTVASIQILNIMLINSCEAGFYLFASIFASSAVVASFLPDDRRLKPASAPIKDPEEVLPENYTNVERL